MSGLETRTFVAKKSTKIATIDNATVNERGLNLHFDYRLGLQLTIIIC